MSHRLGSLVTAAALAMAACGGGAGDADGGESPQASVESPGDQASGVTIKMTEGLQFDPAEVTARVGEMVTWVNDASVDHTATGDPAKAAEMGDADLPQGAEPWDSGFVKPGASFTLTFDVPGTYRYFCVPHENVDMLGVIEVVP
ncbi:MAG TPA: plastocyanin/azurin family copper-binding protein [Actinomycetota bacterium]|jgi:plastocyanin|nr:plastocyanin/azurin family copper-binding protein [Actinomycetota bacterium]